MAVRVDLTLDCANPTRLAEFWKLALGYGDEPPPAPPPGKSGWSSSTSLRTTPTTPRGCRIRQGSGRGCRCCRCRSRRWPRIGSHGRAGGRDGQRRRAMDQDHRCVDRLTAAGATTLREFPGHHVVMADPEANEFCVC